MGIDSNLDAAVIVGTNALREAINTKKAETACGGCSLVTCYALDKCSHKTLDINERHQLLRLNVVALRSTRSLPGYLSLYVGMPVILRQRNLSTDLGITNGSQGSVHAIYTAYCPVDLMYATCVIVHFPSWTFTTLFKNSNGKEEKLQVTHHQLPIQPAFAVTGHSAQGKTLPKVLVNLHEGGFAAYVAASRAQTREGLCI
ncbi:uncharacterized protein F5891DRAFT_945755, partial [Suillus fuscotomentosus]